MRNRLEAALSDIFKFNPHHDARNGQFTTAGQGMDTMAEHIQASGGISYDIHDGKCPTSGFMLSINPAQEHTFSVNGMDKAEAKQAIMKEVGQFIRGNKEILDDKGKFFGAWLDKESGKLFFDVSTHVGTKQKAIDLCKQYNQIAFYDIKSGKEVRIT